LFTVGEADGLIYRRIVYALSLIILRIRQYLCRGSLFQRRTCYYHSPTTL